MPSKWFVPELYLIHEKGAIMAREKLGPTYVLIHAYTEAEHAEVKQMRQKLPEHLAAYLANPDSVLTQDFHEEVTKR